MQRVVRRVDEDAEVGAADAEGIDLAIEFGVELLGAPHVAVGADALDADALAEQVDLDGLVARG